MLKPMTPTCSGLSTGLASKVDAIPSNIGSTPRTAYEIAKWTGLRVSDIVRLRWDMLVTKVIDGEPVEGFEFVEFKGRNRANAYRKFHPMTPMLEHVRAGIQYALGDLKADDSPSVK